MFTLTSENATLNAAGFSACESVLFECGGVQKCIPILYYINSMDVFRWYFFVLPVETKNICISLCRSLAAWCSIIHIYSQSAPHIDRRPLCFENSHVIRKNNKHQNIIIQKIFVFSLRSFQSYAVWYNILFPLLKLACKVLCDNNSHESQRGVCATSHFTYFFTTKRVFTAKCMETFKLMFMLFIRVDRCVLYFGANHLLMMCMHLIQ